MNAARSIVVTSVAARDQADTAPATGDDNANPSAIATIARARRVRRLLAGTSTPERCLTHPAGTLSTPSYTALVGQWSENLLDEVVAIIGGDPDRDLLRRLLHETGQEIDILTGRTFDFRGTKTLHFETNGLPIVEVPDLQRGTIQGEPSVWEIPDPVNDLMTTVVQVAPPRAPALRAIPVGDALFVAGQIVAKALQEGKLDGEYVLAWLGHNFDGDQRKEVLRRVIDPNLRFNVPVLGFELGGWWFQISRRLVWVSNDTEDEGRLLEPLFDMDDMKAQRAAPLCATENVLIVARLTSQPDDWAFSARIWTHDVKRRTDRPWRMLAKVVHGHGIPVITVDPMSSPMEVACQVLLKAYWHGYIGNDEPGLATAIALAFPKQVERVRRGTKAADTEAAAALLLEGLLHPGFDPARGAEANRRYVSRKASIAVMQHRKLENADRLPWTLIGISERRYYKLLPYFAQKVNGRYVADRDTVVKRMREYLDMLDRARSARADVVEVLREHGFSESAARKWLQRHRPEEAVKAWPRKRAA